MLIDVPKLALTLILFGFSSLATQKLTAAAEASETPLPTSQALEQSRRDFEERRLDLDKRKLEQETLNHKENLEMENKKSVWTAVAVAGPLVLGIGAYLVQIFIQRRNEALQFKLKAVEMAMGAKDSRQIERKAKILKALFPKELTGFEPKDPELKEFSFGQSVERRERLIALLAEYPSSREEIIRAWGLLFPWDTKASWGDEDRERYRWFVEIQKDDKLNRNRPSDDRQA
jgi:hypothetical protein